jgi:hypothetical protein
MRGFAPPIARKKREDTLEDRQTSLFG